MQDSFFEAGIVDDFADLALAESDRFQDGEVISRLPEKPIIAVPGTVQARLSSAAGPATDRE